MIIRRETFSDYAAIDAVNRTAFDGEDEVALIRNLRSDGDVLLSLVAQIDDSVIGHILISRMLIDTGTSQMAAVALAPMAVHPDFQKRGIGSSLVHHALMICRDKGESVVLVLGHPTYYPRFGFRAELAQSLEIPFRLREPGASMALELKPGALNNVTGRVKYPRAFGLDPDWTIQE